MWTMLLKEKSEAFDKFKKLRSIVEQETKQKIQAFRSDRGGEFVSHEFNSYYDGAGTKRHLTTPYTPQQNGVVERRNYTMILLIYSIGWPRYELFRGKKPNVSHLRVFGCVGYAKITGRHLKKLDDRSRMLVHLGTEPGSKAYRLYDPRTKRIVVRRDVIFDESRSWEWNKESIEMQSYESFKVQVGRFGNRGISGAEETEHTSEITTLFKKSSKTLKHKALEKKKQKHSL